MKTSFLVAHVAKLLNTQITKNNNGKRKNFYVTKLFGEMSKTTK